MPSKIKNLNAGFDAEELLRKLNIEHFIVLLHLKRAKLDYAKSIHISTKLPIDEVNKILKELEDMYFIERSHGASIKRSEAKFKLAFEVRKHHTYYRLSKLGDHVTRMLRDVEGYFEIKTGYKRSFDVLRFFNEAECEHLGTLARYLSMKKEDVKNIVNSLISMKILEECKAKIIKRKHRKAKPKKETRTHHKYYKLSKLGKILFRYLKHF